MPPKKLAPEKPAREQSPEQIAAIFQEWLKVSNFTPFANDAFNMQQLSDALDFLRYHYTEVAWQGVTKESLAMAWQMMLNNGCVSRPGQTATPPMICDVYRFKRTPTPEESFQAAVESREQTIARRRQEIAAAKSMTDEELQDAARKNYNRKVDPRDYNIGRVRF